MTLPLSSDDVALARTTPIDRVVSHLKLRRTNMELVGPCPECGGTDRFSVNIRKNVFNCRQCGAKGDPIAAAMLTHKCSFREAVERLVGKPLASSPASALPDPSLTRSEPSQDGADYAKERRQVAVGIWRRGIMPASSVVEQYLKVRGYTGNIPRTIRYLPASAKYPPSMVAAYGFAHEIEPGVIDIADDAVVGVHITRLKPDGSDRERGDEAKITIGVDFVAPIVLAPPNDLLGMAIAEGLEKGLAIYAVTGLGVWVSGSAGRMPGLAPLVPSYIEAVTILIDDDPAGRKHSHDLAAKLDARGIEVRMEEASHD
jgi:hypothetical protein